MFSEAVTPDFDADKVTLVNSTLAGTVVVEGSGLVYTVSVALDNPAADGTIGISVGAGLTDLAGTPCAVAASPTCRVCNWREPRFLSQPEGARSYVGRSHTFAVQPNCAGADAFRYQWIWDDHRQEKVIRDVGGNSPAYAIPDLALGHEGHYWVQVTYDGATLLSNSALLEVRDILRVTGPQDAAKITRDTHVFSVVATGGYLPLSYDWVRKGDTATLGTEPNLVFEWLTTDDAGVYEVSVVDAHEMFISKSATLRVELGMPAVGAVGLGLLAGLLALGGSLLKRRKK
jgi:hypothetical protein